MEYKLATEENKDDIYQLVQETIKTIYPQYYPKEVVDFFCNHHSLENISKDIKDNCVYILLIDNQLVATGSYNENHLTRIFVDPAYQGQGLGSYVIQQIEDKIALEYDNVLLDASLSASKLYENRGYKTLRHEKTIVDNQAVLVYEVMEKQLNLVTTDICYDGKYFIPQVNTENGEVSQQTLFAYHQKRNILWAEYTGGEVIQGFLIGTVANNGELDFYYQHINNQNEVRIGKCHSLPHILENGKIELVEEWQWLNGDESKGSSIIVEK